jgi:hypothetical protein
MICVDIERLRELTEKLSFILDFHDTDINLSDLTKVSSLLILKKLKEKANDIERVEFLTDYLENQDSMLGGLISTDDYDRQVAEEIVTQAQAAGMLNVSDVIDFDSVYTEDAELEEEKEEEIDFDKLLGSEYGETDWTVVKDYLDSPGFREYITTLNGDATFGVSDEDIFDSIKLKIDKQMEAGSNHIEDLVDDDDDDEDLVEEDEVEKVEKLLRGIHPTDWSEITRDGRRVRRDSYGDYRYYSNSYMDYLDK